MDPKAAARYVSKNIEGSLTLYIKVVLESDDGGTPRSPDAAIYQQGSGKAETHSGAVFSKMQSLSSHKLPSDRIAAEQW